MVEQDIKEAIKTRSSHYAADVAGTIKSILKLINIFSFDKNLHSIANLLKNVPSIEKFYKDPQLKYKTYCTIYDGNEKAGIPNHKTINSVITRYEKENPNDTAVLARLAIIKQKQLADLQKINRYRFNATKTNVNKNNAEALNQSRGNGILSNLNGGQAQIARNKNSVYKRKADQKQNALPIRSQK